MGTAEIKDAFNAISADATASVVLVWIERDEAGKEWQRILFRGTTAAGQAFEATTERHSPSEDGVAIAQEVARKFVEGQEKEAT